MSEPGSITPLDTGPRHETLTFVLGGDVYGVPLHRVAEILRPPPVTEVPRAQPGILGVISVRGRITTLVDPRRRLGIPPTPKTTRTRVLLVAGAQETIGLWVDAVLKVHRLSESEIELASVLGGSVGEHIRGLGRPGRERAEGARGAAEPSPVIILLDLDALLPR